MIKPEVQAEQQHLGELLWHSWLSCRRSWSQFQFRTLLSSYVLEVLLQTSSSTKRVLGELFGKGRLLKLSLLSFLPIFRNPRGYRINLVWLNVHHLVVQVLHYTGITFIKSLKSPVQLIWKERSLTTAQYKVYITPVWAASPPTPGLSAPLACC